jgi:hypothetical protein
LLVVSTVPDALWLLALLVDETQWAERGVHAVKVDLKKLLKPKKFGWRFIGCDLKMPNGLLIECYIAFAKLMAVDRANHIFFEKWRGKDIKSLSADELRQYEADAKESTKRYNQAFSETLKQTTQNHWRALFDAFPAAKRDEVVKVYCRFSFTDERRLQVQNLLDAVNELRDKEVQRLKLEMADQSIQRLKQFSHALDLLPVCGTATKALFS